LKTLSSRVSCDPIRNFESSWSYNLPFGIEYGWQPEQFSEQHRQWVQEAISNGKNQWESCWTESIAVGGIGFVEETKARLGIKGIGRRIEEQKTG
jgi:hypothetical protein